MAGHAWRRCENELDLWVKEDTGIPCYWCGAVFEDEPFGFGKLQYNSGTEIEGCVQRAKPNLLFHLEGSIQWPDASRYDGSLRDSRPNGFGCCVWVNGNMYNGTWKDGLQHGYGEWNSTTSSMLRTLGEKGGKHAHSLHYEGEWSKNQMHGRGTLTYFARPDNMCAKIVKDVQERQGRPLRRFTGNFEHGYALRGKLETPNTTYKEVVYEDKTTCGQFAAWYWTTTDGSGKAPATTTMRELNRQEEEYEAVAHHMQRLVKTYGVEIKSIQRVQNHNMRELFEQESEAAEAGASGRAGGVAQWAFYPVGPQTGAEAPWNEIAQNGFAGLTKAGMGRSVAAQIQFTKDAADAHKFALHFADRKQQGTQGELVMRLFMSRIVTDVEKDANPGIFVIQDNARAYPAYLIEYLVRRMPQKVVRAFPVHGPRKKAAQLPPGWEAQVHPTTGKTVYRSVYGATQRAAPTAPAVALGAFV